MAITTKETLDFNKQQLEEERKKEVQKEFEENKRNLYRFIIELQENRRKSVLIIKRPNYRFPGFQDAYKHKFMYGPALSTLAKDLSVIDELCELYSSFDHANLMVNMLDKCEAMIIYSESEKYKIRHRNVINALKIHTEMSISKQIDIVIEKLNKIHNSLNE
ncbi:MAG: hypothetical protein KAJ14_11545 [Candidatus Omnitrophica bacterium]|nr:hypothetical protein [Candidatus Omnitrophota bacterium]